MRNTSFENLGMGEASQPIRVTDRRGQSDYLDRVGESLKKPIIDESEKTLEELIKECFMNPGPKRVLVIPDKFRYRGKLIIPDNAERTGTTGTVLKVGYGCEALFWDASFKIDPDKPPGCFRVLQPGDKIAYGTWTGTQFTFDQRPSYRVLMDDEVTTLLDKDHTKLTMVDA